MRVAADILNYIGSVRNGLACGYFYTLKSENSNCNDNSFSYTMYGYCMPGFMCGLSQNNNSRQSVIR